MSLLRVNRRQTEQEHNTPLMRRGKAATNERKREMQLFLKIMGKILYNKIIVF